MTEMTDSENTSGPIGSGSFHQHPPKLVRHPAPLIQVGPNVVRIDTMSALGSRLDLSDDLIYKALGLSETDRERIFSGRQELGLTSNSFSAYEQLVEISHDVLRLHGKDAKVAIRWLNNHDPELNSIPKRLLFNVEGRRDFLSYLAKALKQRKK